MSLGRLVTSFLALVLLLAPLRATWSIVVVDTRTGEVAVGVATCLTSTNLRRLVPVVVPGYGVAAVQCMGDSGGTLRPIIWEELQRGTSPDEILAILEARDPSFDTRQIGLVDLQGRAAAWTGNACGDWKGELVGSSGTLVYSIQGNVLAGAPVVLEAERALLQTPGDLAEKLMAAMEAADAMGGDGRCSCSPFDPMACGSPPPSFSKSAHCGTMLIARPGDPIELCNVHSCARGDFYQALNTKERSASDPNATVILRTDYDAWRAALFGRVDALRSVVTAPAGAVAPGDTAPLLYQLELRDLDGVPLTAGGATIGLEHQLGSAGLASLLQVTDLGTGSYEVLVQPGDQPGQDAFCFVVDDGVLPVSLWPPQRLLHRAVEQAPFHDRRALPELDSGARDLAPWLLGDGLTVYWIGNGTAPGVILRAERPAPTAPFGAPVQVGDPAKAGVKIFDLWVSDDELEMLACGFENGSPVERLFRSRRGLTTEPWPAFTRLEELDSGAGDGGPVVSRDGLQLLFHSARDGNYALWSSRRLDPLGPWLPPVRLAELDAGLTAQFPLLLENATRLVWTEFGPNSRTLLHAELEPDGSWSPRGPLPGAVHPAVQGLIASGYDLVRDELLLTAGDASGAGWIEAVEPAYGSLTASADAVSAASGGVVDFALSAGAGRAGAPYRLVASLSGGHPGARWRGSVLPLVPDAITLLSVQGANQGGLNGFLGTLDAAGDAAPQWDLAAGRISDPGMIGRVFRFVAFAGAGAEFVSQAAEVVVEP